jgi:hypothetical protein
MTHCLTRTPLIVNERTSSGSSSPLYVDSIAVVSQSIY